MFYRARLDHNKEEALLKEEALKHKIFFKLWDGWLDKWIDFSYWLILFNNRTEIIL